MSGASAIRPGLAAIVSVGDEVLTGRVVDTNAAFMSRELEAQGWTVVRRSTVGDDVASIAEHLRDARASASLVLVGGGLGPTADDVTREGIAALLGVPLQEDADALGVVVAALSRSSRALTPENRKQSLMPSGARPIDNRTGTAPGIHWHDDRGDLLAFPGVPRELRAMLESTLVRLRRDAVGLRQVSRGSVLILGLPESEIGRRLADLMERGRAVSVGSYPSDGLVKIVAEARAEDSESAALSMQAVLDLVRARLGAAVVRGDAPDLPTAVFRLLKQHQATLAVAESLTGGRLADGLVGVPGVSEVFLGGVVAYGNAQKTAWLGIDEALLREHGAVSAEVASSMAEAVRTRASATFGLATTGIAGPGGATPTKPVGLVHFALASPEGTLTEQRVIAGDREQVRERAVAFSLDLLRRRLEG